ncbi:hypothetical protein Agub_g4227, partial [Astrephomene gubernaculifera]
VASRQYSPRGRLLALKCAAAAQPPHSGGESQPSTSYSHGSDSSPWWTSINRKRGIQGPNPPIEPDPTTLDEDMVGTRMLRSLERINREERQRVWDAMRLAAADRYSRGEMPNWFDPKWIFTEEAPMNTLERMQQFANEEGLLDDGAGGGGEGGGGDDDDGPISGLGDGGDGWWREDDPYWMLRDWGDHPMRWWTLGFAAVLAAGGLLTTLSTGYLEAVQFGGGAAALLCIAAAGMSDAASLPGVLGVKLAWAVCALIVAKECYWGWQHQRTRRLATSAPRLQLSGLAALAMCAGYMLTDMSALGEVALPTNPGAVFKSPDVAYRSSIWHKWGYGQVLMRV